MAGSSGTSERCRDPIGHSASLVAKTLKVTVPLIAPVAGLGDAATQ